MAKLAKETKNYWIGFLISCGLATGFVAAYNYIDRRSMISKNIKENLKGNVIYENVIERNKLGYSYPTRVYVIKTHKGLEGLFMGNWKDDPFNVGDVIKTNVFIRENIGIGEYDLITFTYKKQVEYCKDVGFNDKKYFNTLVDFGEMFNYQKIK